MTDSYGSLPASHEDASQSSPSSTDGDLSSAKDKALDAAQTGKRAAADVAQTATTAAKDVAQESASQARQLADQTSRSVTEQAGVQKDALVGGLRSLVDQLAGMTEQVDTDGVAVEVAARARDRARSAADWLDQREPGEVLDGLRSFGRERPGVYLAAALGAGLVAGRLTRGVVAVHVDSDDESSIGSTDMTSPAVIDEDPSTAPIEPGRPPHTPVSTPSAGRHESPAPTSGGLYGDAGINRPGPGRTQ